ncbi:hypothetical protein H1W00_12345 [Aeromicrobium sp. Marseille-Q0843]|uniref:Uncharacterized protein n=1 Tax=Aeromicrobium phoceense TaxID=2754045 RepID=A0A838XJU4_9ACTN|nr:hypothetical protein [Aeromicrobium phoceense]MBA4609271.1 hypothetical protein [Aeromicrobium phoceense]
MNRVTLSDQWHSRDLPVLVETADRLRTSPTVASGQVAPAVGIDAAETARAFDALIGTYLLGKVQRTGNGEIYVAIASGVTERGRRATGLWPDGDSAVEHLLSALRQAEELTDDPDDKSALRKASGQLASVSRNVVAEVIAAVVTRQAGS